MVSNKSLEKHEAAVQKAKALLAAKTKKLKAAQLEEKRKISVQKRKDETTRKASLGGFMLARIGRNDEAALAIFKEYLATLESKNDVRIYADELKKFGLSR